MIDHEVLCEFTDFVTGVEETSTVAFAARNDLEFEAEVQAALLGARYGIMPRRRGRTRWEIREPGEMLVVVRCERIH